MSDFTFGMMCALFVAAYALMAGYVFWETIRYKYEKPKPYELILCGLFGPILLVILSPLFLCAAWNWFFKGKFDLS